MTWRVEGVGMDVVRSRIHEIRGVINTDSEVGQGTTFYHSLTPNPKYHQSPVLC